MSSSGLSSPSGVHDQQHNPPPLRARLHALLQHQDSYNGSSPALSPSSDTPSQNHTNADPQSSSTSIDTADRSASSSSAPIKRKRRKGAVNVLSQAPKPVPLLVTSPPPRLADLPRSITTSNLDRIAASAQQSDSQSAGPSRASSLDPSHLSTDPNAPPAATQSANGYDAPDTTPLQRPSIKVRIITWNMHDSVPKGDLEVLLGKAGQFVAPESDWDISYDSAEEDDEQHQLDSHNRKRKGAHVVGQEHIPRADRIPPLPHDDAHPYHLLVIAGQECPWGDGKRLATSVGMAGELGDIGKQKARAAKDKDKDKDKAKPGKKEKQRSGDSDNLPNVSDGSKPLHSSTDEAPTSNLPSDDNSFPFFSGPLSMSLPGQALASPMIGGSSMPGFGQASEQQQQQQHHDDKPAVWPNIGGKGWSDLCEDWLCRNETAKKNKEHNHKPFISGARLARALSHSASKRDYAMSRESFADNQHSLPTHSLSAAVTPELSRAASPIGIPLSTSLPGTPNQSTFERFPASAETSTDAAMDASTNADKRKRLLPKLNLKPIDLVRKTTASGRSSPANLTDTECVSSPLLLSPTAVRSVGQPFSSEQVSHADELATMPASTSLAGLLTVPGPPSMSRMSSSQSLSTLAASGDRTGRSVSPAATEVHVEPPTPSRSPSPCPNAASDANCSNQIPRDNASPTPSAVIGTLDGSAMVLNGPVKTLADSIPKALGPYELVIKERMMGCYMAVYVWRGCKDRVRGASRSHVKSGLLAGRVGNKGGVGISLKLGTTRLLFVNAHLAAHEDKVALRLANVAKIKAALKVDSFLPADDPRSKLEDITEQFDHTFWFGDLNFRIDISRQHADWLMMQKKYDQALAFDQLGKVLKDGDAFKGFQEAPIHFPPTYKYDVLKTLKIKRTKTQTSVRNAIDIAGLGAAAHSTTKAATAELSTTPLGESVIPEESAIAFDDLQARDAVGDDSVGSVTPNEVDVDTFASQREVKTASSAGALDAGDDSVCPSTELQDPDRSDEDRYSIASSSAFGSIASSSGFARSHQMREARLAQDVDPALVRERELELQRQRQLAENTSAAQGPRFFSQGAAIKARFKIMDMVRSATHSNLKDKISSAVSSDNHQGGRRKWLNVLTDSPKKSAMPASVSSDNTSIVDSIGSMPSPATELSLSNPDADESGFGGRRRGSLLSTDSRLSSMGNSDMPSFRNVFGGDGQTSSSDQENDTAAAKPIRAGPRRSSLQMAKATALAAAKAHRDAKYPHLTGATAEQIDFLEAQPYDTSAKQRVPSWCDRVLFRSTVAVEPDDDGVKAEQHETGLGSRVGSAFSNALITPLKQAAERRHHANSQRHVSDGLAAAVVGSSSVAFAQERTAPVEAHVVRKVSAARRNAPVRTSSPSAETRALAGREPARHPHLLQRFLHPSRHRHQVKALSPSLTLSDSPNGTDWVIKNASSVDLMPTSTTLGLEKGAGLGLAGLETRAISTVDLPSQVEERDNRFDGVAKRVASPLLAAKADEEQQRVVIPPRGSSSSNTNSPVIGMGRTLTTSSPTKASTSPASLSPYDGEGMPKPPTRTASATTTPDTTQPARRGPRRTLSSSSHPNQTWMDSLSSHLPSFFAPAISALRSHRQPSSTTPQPTRDKEEEEGEQVVGPKRGQIECLLYKSLDDKEMRVLEARSDHRPVIFVGAIGI